MGQNSKIEWTDHTFNPWIGCSKVSPACANCYAERDFDHRYGMVKWGPNGFRKITSQSNWLKPIHWNAEAWKTGVRKRVFCASLADVFEDWQGHVMPANPEDKHETLDEVRNRLFTLIDMTPMLDWLLLTKRPENIRRMYVPHCLERVKGHVAQNDGAGYHLRVRSNVWLGTSVENQEWADKRIPELLNCRNLSPVLFLSCEPVVGPIDLDYPEKFYPNGPRTCCSGRECGCCGMPVDPPAYLNACCGGVDWVITGGESGPCARPADPRWFRSLRNQCTGSGVSFFFKQWGEFDETQTRVGKKAAGRLLDGVEWNQFPQQPEKSAF